MHRTFALCLGLVIVVAAGGLLSWGIVAYLSAVPPAPIALAKPQPDANAIAPVPPAVLPATTAPELSASASPSQASTPASAFPTSPPPRRRSPPPRSAAEREPAPTKEEMPNANPLDPDPQAIRRADATWQQIVEALEHLRADPNDLIGMHEQARLYDALGEPSFTDSPDYPTHCAELGKWRDRMPDSPVPLVALANAHISWAWEARGAGWASSVTEDGWNKFHTRLDEALRMLERAIKLGVKDGEAHRLRLLIGMAQDAPTEKMLTWFHAGQRLDPLYYPLYRQMAVALMPRWGGSPGELEEFVNQIPTLLPGDNGLDFFGLTVQDVHTYERNDPVTIRWGGYDRDLLRKAARVHIQRYPKMQSLVQFAAFVSLVLQDHQLAQEIAPHVRELDFGAGNFVASYDYDKFVDWSSKESVPSGEKSFIWAGLVGITGLSFAEDSHHLWVGYSHGSRSFALVDPEERRLVLEMPNPVKEVESVIVDPHHKMAVIAASHEKQHFWVCIDLTDPERIWSQPVNSYPYGFAFNPARPQFAWLEQGSLWLMDCEAEDAKPRQFRVPPSEGICFSEDGNLLAVFGQGGTGIFSAETGNLTLSLMASRRPVSQSFACEKVLKIDELGQIWAIARQGNSNDRCLARFSADGKSAELLVGSLTMPRVFALSPRCDRFAIAQHESKISRPQAIDIYDTRTGNVVQELPGHWNHLARVVFSPDGSKLASVAMFADVIKVWQIDGEPANASPAAEVPAAAESVSAAP
jgi:hypothetical protein